MGIALRLTILDLATSANIVLAEGRLLSELQRAETNQSSWKLTGDAGLVAE